MNVLVTGGSGFIGSHFIEAALRRPFIKSLVNIDKWTYAANKELPFDRDLRYSLFKLDINDAEIDDIILSREISHVVHFAAESHVDNSIKDPSVFIRTNINGTYNLLDICKRHKKIKKFIHVSTDEVFGSLGFEDAPFSTKSAYKPNSPYAASKACSDLLVRSYVKTFKFPAIITNCSNNFGPRQFPEKLIPLAVKRIKNLEPVPIYGKGDNIRDWIYVKDHVNALILILLNGRVGGQYLIGGNNEIRNIDLIHKIYSICEKNTSSPLLKDYFSFVEDRKGHDVRYAIDFSDFQKDFPDFRLSNFEKSLEDTVLSYT